MDKDEDVQNMATYKLVEQALINLGYVVDFDLRYHAKLTGYKPVEGYKSDIVIEFRESYKSELGDRDESLEVEWLMDDEESSLFLDTNSLDDSDPNPSEFLAEKIILRENFDRVLMEIKQISQTEHD
ncbi:MAG: hypothetical protein DCF19_23930 [Pseudanabaena frigida]|uniref:Uncharacterized protein n=1 Tax=Pseudanabaena frigida TaxID=945775 RepID=A0A2W4VVV5_9CYAN|nr:MAG: hypothetical protein DCF19_23930 [Pseudanabaena frigida]